MSLSEQQAAALSAETVVVAAGRPPRERDEPVNQPIVLSSTYFGTGALADGDRGYGRYSNPTWDPFEEALGQLEGASLPGLLYASGLAAVSSALSLIPAGGVLVMPSHSYAGSLVMATELAEKGLFELRTVDIADTDAVKALLAPADGKCWQLLWSSEDPHYEGAGTPPVETDEGWHIPGRAAVVMKSETLQLRSVQDEHEKAGP